LLTVLSLIITRFSKASSMAAAWLSRKRYQALFLDLPEDLTSFVRKYMGEEISEVELWRSYGYLTGLQEPFINVMRYRMNHIIDVLPRLKYKMPELEVYCYLDLKCHIEASRLSEKLLLLETRERVRKGIKISEWRELMHDEKELARVGLRRTIENISEVVKKYSKSTVLYGSFIKPFKDCMKSKGFIVEPIYLQHYWRSPLDILRIMIWIRGVEYIQDEMFTRCVKGYLKYLDYVISSDDIDVAHDKWVSETKPDHSSPCNAGVLP